MIIKPTTVERLAKLFQDYFLAQTSKVSKVSVGSVVNATSYGVAKVAQKILKDIALLESNIFPDVAYGEGLDNIAERDGLPARFGALGSSGYVKVFAASGTTYSSASVTFTSIEGLVFDMVADVTVGDAGFAYIKVQSQSTGEETNVPAFSINTINNAPVGHEFVTNEYTLRGGRDAESDDELRRRIKNYVNIAATSTLAKYEQVLINQNGNVLGLYKGEVQSSGLIKFYVSSVNGADFSAGELTALENALLPYLSASEQDAGVDIANVEYFEFAVSLRVETDGVTSNDDIRRNMQVAMQKVLNWADYEFESSIDWESLLIAAKQTRGVVRVLDNYFSPRADLYPRDLQLPRIKGFTLYNENGSILSDDNGVVTPTYFPNQSDWILQQTLI